MGTHLLVLHDQYPHIGGDCGRWAAGRGGGGGEGGQRNSTSCVDVRHLPIPPLKKHGSYVLFFFKPDIYIFSEVVEKQVLL